MYNTKENRPWTRRISLSLGLLTIGLAYALSSPKTVHAISPVDFQNNSYAWSASTEFLSLADPCTGYDEKRCSSTYDVMENAQNSGISCPKRDTDGNIFYLYGSDYCAVDSPGNPSGISTPLPPDMVPEGGVIHSNEELVQEQAKNAQEWVATHGSPELAETRTAYSAIPHEKSKLTQDQKNLINALLELPWSQICPAGSAVAVVLGIFYLIGNAFSNRPGLVYTDVSTADTRDQVNNDNAQHAKAVAQAGREITPIVNARFKWQTSQKPGVIVDYETLYYATAEEILKQEKYSYEGQIYPEEVMPSRRDIKDIARNLRASSEIHPSDQLPQKNQTPGLMSKIQQSRDKHNQDIRDFENKLEDYAIERGHPPPKRRFP